MSIESKELHLYRTDQLSAAAFEAAEHEPPKEVERVENEPNGLCRCCGKWRHIPDGINYCLKCHEEEPWNDDI